MKSILCKQCGSTIDFDDDSEVQIKFCRYCGAPIPDHDGGKLERSDDSQIIDYYVKAIENEIYCNSEEAIKNYKEILNDRPGFAPAQRGLARILSAFYIDRDEKKICDEYIDGLKSNVTISFSSVKDYRLTVRLEYRDDIVLTPGETKNICLDPVSQHVYLCLGRKEFTATIDFFDADTHIDINYLFDGKNHIKIVDDKGNDYSKSIY